MKRSEINYCIEEAIDFFGEHQFLLPEWAKFSPADWEKIDNFDEIVDCQLGWDITGFGYEDFKACGLTLFTLRNGGANYAKTYAEKIMLVHKNQITPCHFHFSKYEDIINRGGGNLIIELFNVDSCGKISSESNIEFSIDGIRKTGLAGEKIILSPGSSVCLTPAHAHTFYADATCMVGEVSKVNDDHTDNCFIDKTSRFEEVYEDEALKYLLAEDYSKYLKVK